MEIIQLTAHPRTEIRKAVHKLRKSGKLPAVLYGHGIEATNLEMEQSNFTKFRAQARDAKLIDLAIGDAKPLKVIVQDIQEDPLTGEVIHVDFHQVRMDEKIQTELPLNFIGESPAVKGEGGILIRNHTAIKVEALPGDLVEHVDADISMLTELNSALHIKDLPIPEGITPLYEPEEVVAVVAPPRTEEELKSLEVEVKEDVESVEGATVAPAGEEGEEAAKDEGAKTNTGEAKPKKEEKK